jgi:hydrogenase maturation protease
VTITEESIPGLDLLELINGYDKVIIIDAIQTSGGTAGHIYRLEPESLNYSLHSSSPHDVNLATALEFGRHLKLPIPQDITIYAIEAADVNTFSEKCTVDVQQVINKCVDMVIHELRNSGYK